MTICIRSMGRLVDGCALAGLLAASLPAAAGTPAGEAFGLVGECGSGKSTLPRAIAGLAPIRGAHPVPETYLEGRRDARFRRSVHGQP